MKSAQYIGDRKVAVGTSEACEPGPNEVRLEVAFCGICGTDMHIFHGAMDQRVSQPQILGHEVSATVAEIGDQVKSVAVGDRVAVRPLKFGTPSKFDNGFAHVGRNLKFIGIDLPGGMQSSWTVPDYTLHPLPASLSLQHGALIEPAAVACHDVRLGRVTKGENCVVIGGGPIGLLIALVAIEKRANVILSEVNRSRRELATSLGIRAVDPNADQLPELVAELTEGRMADCVFEVSGSEAGVAVMTELPNARGRIVMVAIHPKPRPVDLFKVFWSEIQIIGTRLYEEEDFEEAIRLASRGVLHLDQLITKVSPIEHVQEAFEAIEGNLDGIKYLIQCD